MTAPLNIGKAFKDAFSTYLSYFKYFFVLALIFTAIYGLCFYALALSIWGWEGLHFNYFALISFSFSTTGNQSLIIGALLFVLPELFTFMVYKCALVIYNKQPITWQKMFSIDWSTFFTFLGARLLLMIQVALGFFAFIIPGIYILCKYYFVGLPIVENSKLTVQQDSKIANYISKDSKLRIFWLALLTSALIFLEPGVVSLIMYPFVDLVLFYAYKQLVEHYVQELPTLKS